MVKLRQTKLGRIALVVLLVLYFTPARGQEPDVWQFYTLLYEQAAKIGKFDCEEVEQEHFDASLFFTATGAMALPAPANWQLFHTFDYYWEHMVGQGTTVLSPDDLTARKPMIQQCPSTRLPVFSSQTLIEGFDLRAGAYAFVSEPLEEIPHIHSRNDPLNGIWTPIVVGDYLIIRYVASYPDGSQTSFYREVRLYFRKS